MRDSRGGFSDEQRRSARGLTRREMIRASAVAGAAAWTAPVIIDSLVSPAAAGSGLATGISHIDVVFRAGAGAPCSLTNGTYYELYWNLNGWAGPGSGNRCAKTPDKLFSCTGTVANGDLCLITALNAISGLVTTDSCGCILLHTDKLPNGVTACINHSRTFCGHTSFSTNDTTGSNTQDSNCAMPCVNSTSTTIQFCCESNPCCSGSVAASCTC
jgi:hypothetical protein